MHDYHTSPASVSNVLLTIAVPTRNRAPILERLIAHLAAETHQLSHLVQVLVSNNASSDNTTGILAHFSSYSSLTIFHHHSTLSVDKHFEFLYSKAIGSYFWLLGDDDIPRKGLVSQLISEINAYSPRTIFLDPTFTLSIEKSWSVFGTKKQSLHCLPRESFLLYTSYMLPFISSLVVQRLPILSDELPRDFQDNLTKLAQLQWVFSSISKDGTYLVKRNALLCTSANSGGYNPVEIFGVQLTILMRSYFLNDQPALNHLLFFHLRIFLPELIFHWMHSTYPPPNRLVLIDNVKNIYKDSPLLRAWILAIVKSRRHAAKLFVIPIFLFKLYRKCALYLSIYKNRGNSLVVSQ